MSVTPVRASWWNRKTADWFVDLHRKLAPATGDASLFGEEVELAADMCRSGHHVDDVADEIRALRAERPTMVTESDWTAMRREIQREQPPQRTPPRQASFNF